MSDLLIALAIAVSVALTLETWTERAYQRAARARKGRTRKARPRAVRRCLARFNIEGIES